MIYVTISVWLKLKQEHDIKNLLKEHGSIVAYKIPHIKLLEVTEILNAHQTIYNMKLRIY